MPVCSAWEGSFGWHFVPAYGTATLECSPAGRDARLLPLQMEVPLQGMFPARRAGRGEVHHRQQVGNFATGT